MATLKDIEKTYDDFDEIWPIILGDHADITAGYYNGDYSISLEQAQRNKHMWILMGIGFQPGHRILDIGCGWGPMLCTIKEQRGRGVGLTISPKQAETCKRYGLEVHLLDWKELDPAQFGRFDGVISLGAFEHFCSIEEYVRGEQETIYHDFFRLCYELLPDEGVLYLQTMTWGPNVPWDDRTLTAADIEEYVSLDAPKYSDERILAYIRAFFPGSWLPKGKEQIVDAAAPYFDLVKASDGRLDYIQTITEWVKAWYAPKPGLTWAKFKLVPNYIRHGRTYWARMKCVSENAVREVFIRQIFGHQRMFFKKKV